MIALTRIRDLTLSVPSAPGRPLHLSAASGLVCCSGFCYVVADDELHLGVFPAVGDAPGHLIRLFEGELPDRKKARKKRKPDLEALTLLPPSGAHPHGCLLALGSGSRPNRRLGALLPLDANGAISGAPRVVDLSPLLSPLDATFAELNIEGAVVSGGELRLFQRGNKRHSENAVVRLLLADVLAALDGRPAGPLSPNAIDRFDLGDVDGIPLCFTDASALPDGRMVFTAVAEDTDDSYNDGPCAGAAVGIIDGGRLRSLQRLDQPYKVEGVQARIDGQVIRLLLVTDADDAAIPASVFSATMRVP